MLADAGQDMQPLDVVKSKARHCELGQIAPMQLTFCAREWQLLKQTIYNTRTGAPAGYNIMVITLMTVTMI